MVINEESMHRITRNHNSYPSQHIRKPYGEIHLKAQPSSTPGNLISIISIHGDEEALPLGEEKEGSGSVDGGVVGGEGHVPAD
ncbi:hypothetical protein GLYMA_10G111000v4 [Glycine max]|uniref:Uncharacterized protein n=1 Tax=Glycine max TaxID=3847 RepID=A0A0R0HWR8_SOYBN|nr:hypothetical protein GLYMA_10G111000v4 [Glycine max]KAG4996934.1 hypothetical protein JHK85_028373 [Glycine max]KAG5003711.1 hypothetical protein JHK86_027850 [Glycine max]KAG5151494.1 hypothetical protein JHK84_027966 [Glycine max]KRH33266.1 hypothetical protein GLYMA_10G111000v4 [Glycine max]